MTIQITKSETETHKGTTYKSYNVLVEKKEVSVTVVEGNSNYVNVQVKNAVQVAYRGLGKDFDNFGLAIEHYKNLKIQAAIKYVALNICNN